MEIEQLVYVGLGGNMGDTVSYFEKALSQIALNCGVPVIQSSVYQTAPWGFEASQPFLNQVVGIETKLSPEDFLKTCLLIEQQLGRIRQNQGYNSRCIDLDILIWKNMVIDKPNLQIPHPLMADRRFVLEPLSEIAPELIHPKLGITISKMLDVCKDTTSCLKMT